MYPNIHWQDKGEHRGSVVECLTPDQGVVSLVQTRKIRPDVTERLLTGCKESDQTNKQKQDKG